MTQAEAIESAPAVLWHLAHLLQRAVDDPGEVADELYNLPGVEARIDQAAAIIAALEGREKAAVLAEIEDDESSVIQIGVHAYTEEEEDAAAE